MASYNDVWTLAIIAFAVLGIGAAIANFLKTPREQRYRGISAPTIEERLKAYPESAQAVIIRADKRRVLLKTVPYVVFALPPTLFVLWLETLSHPECTRLLGFNAAYLSLLLVCYGLPIGLFILSLSSFPTGIKTVTTGYYPPLDTAVFSDTIAKKGPVSIIRGVVLLVLPILMLFLVSAGNDLYTTMASGKNLQQITEKMESKCR
jgi:hypothetical protein